MSEYLTPDERDELASAYLDGEASEAEIRRVENDAELLSIVEDLRDLAEHIAAPQPAAPHHLRLTHIQSALAAFDKDAATAGPQGAKTEHNNGLAPANPTTTPTTDTSLTQNDAQNVVPFLRRRKLRSVETTGGMPRWLSAAAASLAILGGVAFVTSRDEGLDSYSADSAAESPEAVERQSDGEHSISGADSQMATAEMAEATSAEPNDEAMEEGAMADDTDQATLSDDGAAGFAEDEDASANEESQGEQATPTTSDSDSPTETALPSEIPIEYFFPAGTTATEISEAVDLEQSVLAESVCASAFEASTNESVRVTHFAAINLDGRAAELLRLDSGELLLAELPSCLEVST